MELELKYNQFTSNEILQLSELVWCFELEESKRGFLAAGKESIFGYVDMHVRRPTSQTIIGLYEKEVIGYVLGQFNIENHKTLGEIDVLTSEGIYIKESFRRYGLGTQLKLAQIEDGKRNNCKLISTYVNKTNIQSLGLNQKLGFQVVSEPDCKGEMELELLL